MQETALDLVERLIAEGKSTEEVRDILNGRKPAPKTRPVARAGASAPKPLPMALPSAGIGTVPQPEHSVFSKGGLGWLLIILVCAIPAIALMLTPPLSARFGSPSAWLLTIGGIAGVSGFAMYAMTLVLSTRMSWFEDLFGGLNRVMAAHQTLGALSLILILIHPLFASASYYTYGLHTVAHFFVPQWAYIGTAYGIYALILMIGLLFVTLYMKLQYRVWLTTHKWLGLVYLLIVLHVLFTPNHMSANHFLRWYLYLLILVGSLAYIYRSLLPNIFVRRYLYTIVSAEKRGVGVVEVTLMPVQQRMRFKAGQFIFMSFNNDGLSNEWHPFSISSAENSDKLVIDVKSLGAYTETLTRLLPYLVGVTVRVEGAYGRFSYQNFGNLNQVWVAGGIGITPFLSMAQGLSKGPYNIDLYYSVKTESELIDLSTLAVHQQNTPGQVFRVFPFISDKYNTFLNADIIAKNSGSLRGKDFLICGPPPMMHSLTKQLMGRGVPERRIHSEEFALN